MYRNLFLTIALLATTSAANANDALVQSLFGDDARGDLSDSDRRAIAALLPMSLRDGVVVSSDQTCAGSAMRPNVTLVELNGVSPTEVIVEGGNSCTSGMTGQNVWLLSRSADAKWRVDLDVVAIYSGTDAGVSEGWRDLRLSGRGHCDYGIWARRGGAYGYVRSIFKDGSPCTP